MKIATLLLALLLVAVVQSHLFINSKCSEDDQIDCADDIRKGTPYIDSAFPVCEKAAQEGGSDTEADLECIKYFNSLKLKCWPCICVIAAIDHVTVKGC